MRLLTVKCKLLLEQAVIQKAKDAVKWIVLPLTLLFGLIWYLLTQISGLKSQLRQAKSEAEVKETLTKLEEAKENADELESDFGRKYDDYKRSFDDDRSGGLPN